MGVSCSWPQGDARTQPSDFRCFNPDVAPQRKFKTSFKWSLSPQLETAGHTAQVERITINQRWQTSNDASVIFLENADWAFVRTNMDKHVLRGAHMNQAFGLRGVRLAAREPFEVPGGDSDNLASGILQDSQQGRR